MPYIITSDEYPKVKVVVYGSRIIAYGVAESITKQQKITTVIKDENGNKVDTFVYAKN